MWIQIFVGKQARLLLFSLDSFSSVWTKRGWRLTGYKLTICHHDNTWGIWWWQKHFRLAINFRGKINILKTRLFVSNSSRYVTLRNNLSETKSWNVNYSAAQCSEKLGSEYSYTPLDDTLIITAKTNLITTYWTNIDDSLVRAKLYCFWHLKNCV